ncbi:MAG: SURF1 family protein [Gammaproteobacteria bacterium]
MHFKATLLPTVVTFLLLYLLVSLGFWQLDRAEKKHALLAEYRQGDEGGAVFIRQQMANIEELAYQMARSQGHYDSQQQLLLDNRTHDGQAGYHVVTPLRLADGSAVLVNRGWVSLGRDRAQLPDVSVNEAGRQVVGRIKPLQADVFRLGEELLRERWPYRVQHIDVETISAELGYPVMPFVLLLASDQADGFVRDWKPLTFGPERNQGYAVQWFGLAVALLLIYIVVNIKRES